MHFIVRATGTHFVNSFLDDDCGGTFNRFFCVNDVR